MIEGSFALNFGPHLQSIVHQISEAQRNIPLIDFPFFSKIQVELYQGHFSITLEHISVT